MELTFYKDNGGKYRWRVVADNGRIVGASSQGFASKQMAEENTELLKDALTYAITTAVITNNGG